MSRGASNGNSANSIFATVSKRGLLVRVEEQTSTSKERKLEAGDNIGKVVHEEIYSQLEGQLIDIKYEENAEFGDAYKVKLDTSADGKQEQYIISMKANSAACRGFLKQLPKADLSIDVIITCKYEEPKEGYKYGSISIGLLQAGSNGKNKYVGYAHTIANPNGLPGTSEYQDGDNKTRKSYFDQNNFLKDFAMGLEFNTPKNDERKTPVAKQEAIEDEEDLPF